VSSIPEMHHGRNHLQSSQEMNRNYQAAFDDGLEISVFGLRYKITFLPYSDLQKPVDGTTRSNSPKDNLKPRQAF
jgi:hypothetical protein